MYVHRMARFIVGAVLAVFVMAGIGAGTANAQTQTPAQLLQAESQWRTAIDQRA